MSPSPRNVELDPGFGSRLATLREASRLSKAELADRATLSYRTILNLESGSSRRIQEKTVMLLAEALAVSVDDLLGRSNRADTPEPVPATEQVAESDSRPDPATVAEAIGTRPAWRLRRLLLLTLAAVSIIVIVVAAVRPWHAAPIRPEWNVDDGRLTVRDEVSGQTLWTLDATPNSLRVMLAPWSEEELIVAASIRTAGGGWLRAYDHRTGRQLWEVGPDLAAVERAFGPEVAYAAGYSAQNMISVDFEGDGEPELLAVFIQGLWYPSCLCTIDAQGRLLAQYTHRGHVPTLIVYDIDGDGREEVIVGGTNNTPDYQGATLLILDDQHRHGASIDHLSEPASLEPDSALVRVVLPHFEEPYRSLMSGMRLTTTLITIATDDRGGVSIIADISDRRRPGFFGLIATFDHALRPINVDISDGFLARIRTTWPDSLRNGMGPADPAWRERWLSGLLSFEAGHWPPARVDDQARP